MPSAVVPSAVLDHSEPPRSPAPPHIRIAIDRGGTFSDCWASRPLSDGTCKEVVKLLSVDPTNYPDAPTEACRRVLEIATCQPLPGGHKVDTTKIDYNRLSTTIATNALLERTGASHAFVVTKGFRDLLRIGNKSRPNIFAFNIRRTAEVLYDNVLEVVERVTLVGCTNDPAFAKGCRQIRRRWKGYQRSQRRDCAAALALLTDLSWVCPFLQGVSGEAVQILKKPDAAWIRSDFQAIYDRDIRCLAICLAHSYTYPTRENLVASLAGEIGFTHISVSSRATSASADAYLSPVLKDYLASFFKGFDDGLANGESQARVVFMTSEGTLVDVQNFSGLKSILSGLAGGAVGYSLKSWDAERKIPIIGFDMGVRHLDRFDRMSTEVRKEVERQGFEEGTIEVECYLNMRYDGSDTSLMTFAHPSNSFDFHAAFLPSYKSEFGFLLDSKSVMVGHVRVRGIGTSHDGLGESVLAEAARLEFAEVDAAKAEKVGASIRAGGDVPVFVLENLATGEVVKGPAAVVDGTQTLNLDPGASAQICLKHVFVEWV
ncbi:SPOSA6832_00892 [Sporobolomyces salmonicolor]|uniref:SPOSA6832_00892-mRNA-1:cds n=1 Tax=Sporidiobolus salmonicolor TaxID=5005 RepID=A0A0D6EIG1_SPOSA|nr:SPOSA6832_00892 [Sporobolomyces salmonicolor]